MIKKLLSDYMSHFNKKEKEEFKKLILYSEPYSKYRSDVVIQLPEYKLYFDKYLNIFYRQYNLFFDLPEDIKEYIIDILHNSLKKTQLNMSYLTRIRNIQQTRKEISYLIKCAKRRHRQKKIDIFK